MDPRTLVPHRPPILCIDTVVSVDAERAIAEHTVPEGDEQWEGLLIEGLAQTAAVLNSQADGGAGRGLLVGLRGLEVHRRARAGERVRFEVDLVRRLPPLVLVQGRACVDDEVLGEGELKFFVEESGE